MTTLESRTSSVHVHRVYRRFAIFNHPFIFILTGGNSIDKAPPSAVKDFVKENGGHTVITKVR